MIEHTDQEIYLLKGTCVPVTGFNRGVIYNLVDNTYSHIPRKYSLRLEKSRIVDPSFSDEAIAFFENHNLILRIKKNQVRQFPAVRPEYIAKKDLEHVLIEVDPEKLDLLEKIIDKFKEFKIRSFEFILVKNDFIENNICALNFLKNTVGQPKALNLDAATYGLLKANYDFSSFDYLKQYSYSGSGILGKGKNAYHYADMEYWKMTRDKLYFNFEFFAESLRKHPIFNKMLFIDKEGDVKQNPLGDIICNYTRCDKNMIKNLGTSLWWTMSKESCDVCKDCEYRHMCVDARLPSKCKDSIYHFDSECNYNPYICAWKGDEGWMSVGEWRGKNQKQGKIHFLKLC